MTASQSWPRGEGGRRAAASAESAADLAFRRPTENDHRRLIDVVDDWFGGRRVRDQFARFWFRHFSRTSWLAETTRAETTPRARTPGATRTEMTRPETTRAEIAGILLGFLAPDDPRTAVIHLVAVNPNLRRRGIGRALVERFAADARAARAEELVIVIRPDEPIAVRFLRALGFEPDAGPGTQALYGVPAYPDYEREGEDRAIFRRALSEADLATDAAGAEG